MMLRILVPPLWSLVLLILGASLVIGPWPGALLRWFRLRISPANAKGITARPMMRASLLPKVPTRALAPKTKNATQSVVLNPMLPPKADAGPQADTALFIQLAPVKPSSLHRARFGNHVARFLLVTNIKITAENVLAYSSRVTKTQVERAPSGRLQA